MAWPTLKVEIAFASDPLDDTPTWVDVSAYVRQSPGLTVRRGRDGQPQSADNPGVCTFTLDNRDRRFDPTYAAGTYYGQLKARKQVRVTATWSAVDYPVFYGFVTGFPVTGAAMGKDSTVEVTAYDGLSYLAGARLASDPLYDYVTGLTSEQIWLRDITASSWIDLLGARTPNAAGGVLKSSATMAPGMRSPAWASDSISYVDMAVAYASGASAWSLSFWVQTTAAGPFDAGTGEPDAPLVSTYRTASSTAKSDLSISTAGTLKMVCQSSPDQATATSLRPINDGKPHHVVVTRSGSSMSIYIDGELDTNPASQVTAGSGYFGLHAQLVGAGPVFGGSGGEFTQFRPIWSTAMQDLSIYNAALSAAQVEAIYNLSSGVVPETATVRITRILDDMDWPAAWRDLTADPSAIVGELVYNQQAALAALQQVERSEQGRVFVAKNGYVTLLPRFYWLTVTRSGTSQITLSDDGSDNAYRTLGYALADDDVCNDMTVTVNLPPTTSRSTDATSKTTYGTIADTTDTNLSTYEQARDMAAGLVYLRKDASVRFQPATLGVPTSWATVFGLELGDRYTIEATPMGVGSQSSQVALIDSLEWSISAAGWWLTVAGTPVPANGFWVLGTSVLDTSTVLAF